MVKKIKELYLKYKEQLLYLIFGGLTTVVDFTISYLLYFLWTDAMETSAWLVHVADSIGWVAAVTFAFFTNRIWVFESNKKGFLPVMGELAVFAGGRVATFLVQEGIMLLFVTWLKLNAYVFRFLAAILVIVLNYIISKLLVFRKKKEDK